MDAGSRPGGYRALGTSVPPAPPGTGADPAAPASHDPGSRPTTEPTPRERSNAVHVALFVVALIVWYGIAFGLGALVAAGVMEDWYLSQQALDQDMSRATTLAIIAVVGYAFATIGPITTRVGYRVRDALFLIIPLYSFVFLVKILWRWTGLPDRYWETPWPYTRSRVPAPALPEVGVTEVGASAGSPTASGTRHRPMALLAGVVGLVVIAGTVVYAVSQREGGDDWWRTEQVRGLSISLPPTFDIFTDPEDYAAALSDAGTPATEGFAEILREFPEFFVLVALEPTGEGSDVEASVLVMRYPSGGEPLDVLADWYQEGIQENGYEVIAREETAVGTGRYSSVRIDNEGQATGLSPSRDVDYVVDGGAQTWTITFSAHPEEYARFSAVFDRSIASLTLP